MSERGIKRTLVRTAIDTVMEPAKFYGTEHWDRSIEALCQLGEMYLDDKIVEPREMSIKVWAEAVVNRIFSFRDVPDDLKPDVNALIEKLFDPNAPVLPMTMTNYVMKNGKLERD